MTNKGVFELVTQPRYSRVRRVDKQHNLSEEAGSSNPAKRGMPSGRDTGDTGTVSDSDDFDDEEEDNGSIYEEPSSIHDSIPSSRSRISQQNSSQHEDTEGSAHATLTAPSKPRRGRRPTHLSAASRNARDIARKTNHSRIEKRRREKINDVLDVLRGLVPSLPSSGTDPQEGHGETEVEDGEDEGRKGRKRRKSNSCDSKPSAKKEKGGEFKLDVLERTLNFVQHLMSTVQVLEAEKQEWLGRIPSTHIPSQSGNNPATCTSCGRGPPVSGPPESSREPARGQTFTPPIPAHPPGTMSKRKRERDRVSTPPPTSPIVPPRLPSSESSFQHPRHHAEVSNSRITSSPQLFVPPETKRPKLPSISSILNSTDESPIFQLPSPPSPYAFEHTSHFSKTPSSTAVKKGLGGGPTGPFITGASRYASATPPVLPSPATTQIDPTSPLPFTTLTSPSIPLIPHSQPATQQTPSTMTTATLSYSSSSMSQAPSRERGFPLSSGTQPINFNVNHESHDDETVAIASMLMQISSRKKHGTSDRPSSSSPSSASSPATTNQTHHPHTPSSILGL
ncbi:uncharacterized protein EI90DRAFT_3137803 [Cantharellus anzutake]|uniref:uncharacterized protein n=1 Tax=Cantharellus anzutake TaxID=1750568 RepID=UPI0019070BD7|nr:uncharacterized protein EI90DRAFT_3137803 [Cantharellus anzutake]KAF8311924.1 hypothetical protein EI90DRAFT_3137803 [Cantharellus anzutake]